MFTVYDATVIDKQNIEITTEMPEYCCYIDGIKIFSLQNLSAPSEVKKYELDFLNLRGFVLATQKDWPMFDTFSNQNGGTPMNCSLTKTKNMIAKN